MNKEEVFKKYLLELKHNRDFYSKAKIIELIQQKYNEIYKLK